MSVEKIQVSFYDPTRITGTLHEDVFTFMTIPRKILLRMRNVLDKGCGENRLNTFYVQQLLLESSAVYEIMEPVGPQITSQYGA